MGLFKRFAGEFVDTISWNDDSENTIIHRHRRYADEIKDGARLIVRESQCAIFLYDGEVVRVVEPGSYELETDNTPFVTTLENIRHGLKSPNKGEIYFCSMRRFVDMKWGTKRPVTMRDVEFGAIRLRAFGNYSFRLQDPVLLLRELAGTGRRFTTEDVREHMRSLISSRFTTLLGQLKIPVLDLAAGTAQLEEYLTAEIAKDFTSFGLELTSLFIENISLPEAVENALDAHLLMGIAASPNFFTNPHMLHFFTHKEGDEQLPSLRRGWYINSDHKTDTPCALEELALMIEKKSVTPTTLIWKQGMSDWTPAGEVELLRPLFTRQPPPLP